MKDLEVLSEIALNLINRNSDFDDRINSVLSLLGSHMQVSRVYIFMDSPDELTTSNTYEWCGEGILPQIDELQGIPYECIPGWRRLMEEEGRVFSENISTLPGDIKAILEPQGIKSLLVYPLPMDRVIKGFIGFDENVRIRHWKERDLELLRTISGIIGNAYFAEQKDRQLKEYSDLLERKVEERTGALEESLERLRKTQNRMIRQEKMAFLGQLAAGVAHEINNPAGVILSNIHTLADYLRAYRTLLELYGASSAEDDQEKREELRERAEEKKKEEDLDFIQRDTGALLEESIRGIGRISKIVRGLQSFANESTEDKTWVNIKDVIENALHLAGNKLGAGIGIINELPPLPAISGSEHQLHQVFLNLFLNASDAMGDRGTITIRGTLDDRRSEILIEIEDSGSGIPPESRGRIFEPFYSTKEVNRGTGLGLAVAHGIMKAHQGGINIKDIGSRGSCFQLHFPLAKEES